LPFPIQYVDYFPTTQALHGFPYSEHVSLVVYNCPIGQELMTRAGTKDEEGCFGLGQIL